MDDSWAKQHNLDNLKFMNDEMFELGYTDGKTRYLRKNKIQCIPQWILNLRNGCQMIVNLILKTEILTICCSSTD